MSKDNPNLIKNGGKGQFFGNLLRGALSIGKILSPNIVGLIANATGLEDVPIIKRAIQNDSKISESHTSFLIEQLEKDEIEIQEITKRWESDNKSQDWLPRNVRPLALINMLIMFDVLMISALFNRTNLDKIIPLQIPDAYVTLFVSAFLTVLNGYFLLRTIEKRKEKQ